METKSIAFITTTLTSAELPFILINEINKYLKVNSLNELCIYNSQRELPILRCNCAVYHTIDLVNFNGQIIATDIPSWQIGMIAKNGTEIIIAYDLFKFEVDPQLVKKINESGSLLVGRTAIHRDKLKSLGYVNVSPATMDNIDIPRLIELLRK